MLAQKLKEVRIFGEDIRQIAGDIAELNRKVEEAFTEAKKESGSMIKFS